MKLKDKKLRDKIYERAREQTWAEIRYQLKEKIAHQVWNQISLVQTQIKEQIKDQIIWKHAYNFLLEHESSQK